jgi:hypothetical protein
MFCERVGQVVQPRLVKCSVETPDAGLLTEAAEFALHGVVAHSRDPVWVASYTDSATCKAVAPFGSRLP